MRIHEEFVHEANRRMNSFEEIIERCFDRIEEVKELLYKGQNPDQEHPRKKKNRRCRHEIQRGHSVIISDIKCKLKGCEKAYGSLSSLKNHIRIKHPEISWQEFLEKYGGQEPSLTCPAPKVEKEEEPHPYGFELGSNDIYEEP